MILKDSREVVIAAESDEKSLNQQTQTQLKP